MSRLKRDLDKLREWQRTSKPLSRSGRIKPVGRRKKREKRQKLVDGPLCERVKKMPCLICGRSPVDPHHVRTKGAGFKDYLPNGDGNVVPLCSGPDGHHTGNQGVHTLGPETFASRFDVDLSAIAKEIGNGEG